MEQFYPFFLIIFSGVFFSMLSIRTHIPWAVMLIIGGIILGPGVFNVLEINTTIEFLGEIGLIFLMFMAGLETKFSNFKEFKSGLLALAFINGAVPFLVGVLITMFLGYSLVTAVVIGIMFVSSSIAVVIPSLELHKILHTKLGQSVVITTVLQDIISLIILSALLQTVSPVTEIPLYVFYPILLGVLVALRLFIPRLREYVIKFGKDSPDLFQLEFRSTFLMLIGTVIAFELLGLHPIVAGFFSGLVLADSIKSKVLKEKIKTISYGVFIPIFFIVIGLQSDISVFNNFGSVFVTIGLIVFGLIVSKYISGWVAARAVGFDSVESSLFAATSIPQLSTTLATAFIAFNFGLIDQLLLTSLIVLSVVTVLISPILIRNISLRLIDNK